VTKLSKKIRKEGKWSVKGETNKICKEKAECIRRSTKEVLGVSKRGSGRWRELRGGVKR